MIENITNVPQTSITGRGGEMTSLPDTPLTGVTSINTADPSDLAHLLPTTGECRAILLAGKHFVIFEEKRSEKQGMKDFLVLDS